MRKPVFSSGFLRITTVSAVLLSIAAVAYAQGGGTTSSLSGTVLDVSGAVIPGAEVKVKNDGTGTEYTTITFESGTFTIPALPPGTYTATVSLPGFKTVVLSNIALSAGVPSTIRVILEVGGVQETVSVEEGAEIVQTQSSAVATTMNVNAISNLPLASRNALDIVTTLPGVNTPAGSRDSRVNGLPQGAINITLDGASVQDNYLKTTDGFFTRLQPRLDAVEEVTVTSAVNGADTGGQGAVQIQFTTRSGSNTFNGSVYHYYRNDILNANTWFNNRDLPQGPNGKAPRADLLQNQLGFRLGGPVWIPGVYDGHNKFFFFVNYEQSRAPSRITRNRTILDPLAQQGIFRYNTSSGVRSVNLLTLASAAGQTSTIDPTISKLLSDIRSATSSGTLLDLTDPTLQRATFQLNARNVTPYPTYRLDYNLSSNHRLTASFNRQHVNSTPDTTNNREPVFPGFTHTGSQQSTRYSTSNALRSTLSATLINELRGGATGGATYFSPELNPSMWSAPSIPDQSGFQLAISAAGVTNPASTTAFSAREASTKFIEDKLNWVRGRHSLSLGASWTQVDLWLKNQTLVPTINFGLATGDPAESMFTTTNFPGASTTNLNSARALYSTLTGRITSITGASRLNEATNKYQYLGLGTQRARMREMGFYLQDSWRWKRNFTINYGLRYELQLPFYPLNDSYLTATIDDIWGVSGIGNLFKPGVLAGKKPEFVRFGKGVRAFEVDKNNLAPSLGLAWTPGGQGGVLGKILGREGDSVLRAGYALAYNRNGMSDFSGVFGANPGVSITSDRNQTLGNLGPVPLFLSQRNLLGPPAVPEQLTLPFREVITGDINIFEPTLQAPYAQTWSAGWQRKITGNFAVEIRYVGTRHLQGWTEYNYNEANIVENGFLDEFKRAQANLQANVAAGRGATFAYTGIAGTSPLPVYLAYLNGVNPAQAGDPARYTGSAWTSTNWTNPLAIYNPNPFTPAGSNANTGLDGSATRRANAAAAGLPSNYFRVNPDLLGGANITGNGGFTRYDSLQIEFRRRQSSGLQFQGSYVFGKAYESNRFSFRKPRLGRLDTGAEGGVTHAFKLNWVYDLPFGRGRSLLSNTGALLDLLAGGWSFDGISTIQTGRLVNLGNVRLVGMTRKDVEQMYKLRFNDAARVVYMLPQDVVDETIKAFSVSATSRTGYGDLGAPAGRYFAPANGPDCIEVAAGFGDCGTGDLVVTGPSLVRFDLSAVKRIPIGERVRLEFRGEFRNAFNTPYFTPVAGIGSDPDAFRVVAADSGRNVQIVSRIAW
jgi:hypothetical protein